MNIRLVFDHEFMCLLVGPGKTIYDELIKLYDANIRGKWFWVKPYRVEFVMS